MVSSAEFAISVLRTSSVEHRKAGNLADAGTCEIAARSLELDLRNLYASPVDIVPTEPDRSQYLESLRSTLGIGTGSRPSMARGAFASAELVQWMVQRLLEGREHVLALREPAELFATDIQIVANADHWVARIDQGPPISRPPPVPTPTPPPFPKQK